MAWFKRNNPTTNAGDNSVPVDLQQYYSSGSSGILRWILRIVLLLIILALLVWGGIWLFRTLSGNDEPAKNPGQGNTSQQNPSVQTDAQKRAQAEADAKKARDEAAAKAKAAQEKAAAEARNAEEQAKKKAAAVAGGGTATAPPPVTPATPAPATGGSGAGEAASLPATGPRETIISIFGAAAVLGAIGHMLFQRRQARQA